MPPKTKTNALAQRKAEQLKQQQKQKTRRLIWFSTVGVLLVLIIAVLAIQPKAKATSFDYANLPVLGNAEAPVKIVEFGDFQCPACKNVNQLIKPELVKDYIDQGKVAFYFMNLPFIGTDSTTAALAAQAVYHQNSDAYWTYFDAIYERQGDENAGWASAEFFVELAKELKLPIDYDQLQKDIAEATYQNEVEAQYAKGNKLGVDSTPTFFINGLEYAGNVGDYAALKKYIDQELQSK
ncbi:DsbA family protein [Paenibacillus oralis]|uniref:DsbA family protein n=1 Tax=Paenibacillus oralis TaxID=2490856 RepID=A0A3P3U9J9_9BACL|nr:thioredoxin domain-containing protein [Paenibacillus oralis]RRJ67027.1 DsbA family protein [Paenibacillus oralis]